MSNRGIVKVKNKNSDAEVFALSSLHYFIQRLQSTAGYGSFSSHIIPSFSSQFHLVLFEERAQQVQMRREVRVVSSFHNGKRKIQVGLAVVCVV